jgi:GNAT superfamily N-acetyltransferase
MLEIKKSSTNDIPLIQQLSKEIWNKVYPTIISQDQIDFMLDMMYNEGSLQQQMGELNHQFIVIYFSGTPIGFASYSVKSSIEPTVIRLNKLYLQPDYHGRGLGKAMMEFIIKESKLLSGSMIELNVNKYNPAVSFYKKQGFVIASETVLDIGNGYVMDDFIMTLPI